MAQDWIKVEKATARKPEVLRISSALNIHPDHAFGLCVRFWCWCDDQLSNGHALGVTNVTLDLVIGHTGFATQLRQSGWLVETNDGLSVPHFDYHLSQSAKTRAQSVIRKQKSRSKCDIGRAQSVTKVRPEKIRVLEAAAHECVSQTVNEQKTFKRPTRSEAESYAISINAPTFDADAFLDHYDSNGWKVGGKAPMKDWKAAIRTWVKRSYSTGVNNAKLSAAQSRENANADAFATFDAACERAYGKAENRGGPETPLLT